ncbi:MAG: sulfite exporter TauE/SafE family protein [Nitrosomonadales bacterium]|nr:sulfite exporter TauE/SafE family protein [Nitrosomonadales bacterium]
MTELSDNGLLLMLGMGLLGSLHCLGMCGGLVCVLSMTRPQVWWTGLFGYQMGRVSTYVLFGLVAGLFGAALAGWGGGLVLRGFAVLAGIMMVVFGLNLAGWLPDPLQRFTVAISQRIGLAGLARRFAQRASLSGWYVMGMANGLLPCGLVYAALGLALASGSVEAAMLKMALFGLGTIPAMLLAPVLVRRITPQLRGNALRIAGVVMILLGMLTMLRDGSQHSHHATLSGTSNQCMTGH